MTPELRALLARDQETDPEEVLKLCNAGLKVSKNDADILRTKAVALLKLDRFDDAVRIFEDSGRDLKVQAVLEHAYALYKSGQLEKARMTAQGLESRAAKHLVAQAVRIHLHP